MWNGHADHPDFGGGVEADLVAASAACPTSTLTPSLVWFTEVLAGGGMTSMVIKPVVGSKLWPPATSSEAYAEAVGAAAWARLRASAGADGLGASVASIRFIFPGKQHPLQHLLQHGPRGAEKHHL